jgi:hypothetical protein
MNWPIIVSTLLGFVVFTLIMMTILFYINFRVHKAVQSTVKRRLDPLKGRYFKRFIPRELKPKYEDILNEPDAVKIHPRVLYARKFTYGVMTAVAIVTIIMSYHWRFRFMLPIELTEAELADIRVKDLEWTTGYSRELPKWNLAIHEMQSRGIVLLQNRTDREFKGKESGKSLGEVALASWQEWADNNKIPIERCSWGNLNECRRKKSKAVWVVLPGLWEQANFDRLASFSVPVVVYGAPVQTFSQNTSFELDGLKFLPDGRAANKGVILKSDRTLTAGFPPLSHFAGVPLSGEYHVESDDPVGVAIESTLDLHGPMDARVQSYIRGNSRFVWTDISPNITDHPTGMETGMFESFWAATFNYVIGNTTPVAAHWPQKSKYAVTLIVDSKGKLSQNMLSEIKAAGFEGKELYAVGLSHAQERRDDLFELSEIGTISCNSPTPKALAEGSRFEQAKFLTLCKKLLKQITYQQPATFYSPTPNYSPDFLDAFVLAQYQVLVQTERTRLWGPRLMVEKNGPNKVVVLTRPNNDFYDLRTGANDDYEQVIHRMQDELKWVKALGGLYVLVVTDDENGINTLKTLSPLMADAAFKESPINIGKWILSREATLRGDITTRNPSGDQY